MTVINKSNNSKVSHYESAPKQARADHLTALPTDLFHLIANWLPTVDTAFLSQVNKQALKSVRQVQKRQTKLSLAKSDLSPTNLQQIIQQHPKLTCLDLSQTLLDDVGLETILRAFPHLTSINLSGCPNITGVGIRLLAQFVKGKPIAKIDISGRYHSQYEAHYCLPLASLNQLRPYRNPTDLLSVQEAAFLDQFENPNSPYADVKLTNSDCIAIDQSIQRVPLDAWDELIEHLDFAALEYFDISNTSFRLGNQQAERLIAKLQTGSKLTVCHVSFSIVDQLSANNMHRLLTALPLQQMTQLHLGWSLNAEHLAYITSQLAENFALESIILRSRSLVSNDSQELIELLLALNTPSLTSLWYEAANRRNGQHPEVRSILLEKLAHWPNIEKINIDHKLSLYELKTQSPLLAASASPIRIDPWSQLQVEVQTDYRSDNSLRRFFGSVALPPSPTEQTTVIERINDLEVSKRTWINGVEKLPTADQEPPLQSFSPPRGRFLERVKNAAERIIWQRAFFVAFSSAMIGATLNYFPLKG